MVSSINYNIRDLYSYKCQQKTYICALKVAIINIALTMDDMTHMSMNLQRIVHFVLCAVLLCA